MNAKPIRRRRTWAITGLALFAIFTLATYGHWGYERQLAIDVHPILGTVIQPERAFAIEYRKRITWLPGPDLISTAVDQEAVDALRPDAIVTYDVHMTNYHGQSYVFISDYEPDPDWILRDTSSKDFGQIE